LLIHEVPVSTLPPAHELTELTAVEFYETAASGPRVEERRIARYAAAWGLVHFFELGAPDLRSKWHAYLGEMAAGQKSPGSAWRSNFENTTLQTRWLSYVQRSELPYLELEYQPSERNPPHARALFAPEVDLHLARLSWLSGDQSSVTLERLERAALDPMVAVRADLLHAAIALEASQLSEARAALLAVLQRQPDQEHALPLLVEVELQLSQRDRPPFARPPLLHAVERSRRAGSDPWRSVALAQFELAFGDAQRAATLSGNAVQSSPRCARCWLVHALALAATGETASALKSTERASHLLPETADRSGIVQLQVELRARLSATP
jgi:tetratricopeptide (TPR) repeat protein